MIKSVTVTNPAGENLVMELTKPENSGFNVKNISGIGPVNAVINTTEMASVDGGFYNSARVGIRNIVLTLALFGNDIESVRHTSYRFFPVKKEVTLTFLTDRRYVAITGYVESNEPNIFSKEESISVSVLCPDPFFYDLSESGLSVVTFSPVINAFEFPFWNDSLTENLLEFGVLNPYSYLEIDYDGEIETGMVIDFYSVGPASNIEIRNEATLEKFVIDTSQLSVYVYGELIPGKEIIEGDHIRISTLSGRKRVTLTRDGREYNIINAVDRTSSWLTLRPGANQFQLIFASGMSNLTTRIEKNTIFDGV